MINASDRLIKKHFGSKSGLLNYIKYTMAMHLGFYNDCLKVDFARTPRLIFICSGNICRSPLAEYVAKDLGLDTVSYGLHCRGGDCADPRAIAYAASIGINLSVHITQNIKDYVPQQGDVLVGMEPCHLDELKVLFPQSPQITLAGLWLKKKHPYIHDPFSTSTEFFVECERQVENAVRAIGTRFAINSVKQG